ncbi:MAG TPA: hypothetical protein VK830_06095 [Xanthomonadales bacterium]|nr:hypothetical protein [Xanthomonadales bacterium]
MKPKATLLILALSTVPAWAVASHDYQRISPAEHQWALYYAETAVRQSRIALRSRCGYHGNRWSTHFRQHYDWALRKSRHKAQVEIDRRSKALHHCESRYGWGGHGRHDDHGYRGYGMQRGYGDGRFSRDRGRRGHGRGHG